MSRIVLTFKNNPQEKKIEKFLDSKLSPAGYIKELVWAVMNGNSPEIASTKRVSTESGSDIIEFTFNVSDEQYKVINDKVVSNEKEKPRNDKSLDILEDLSFLNNI